MATDDLKRVGLRFNLNNMSEEDRKLYDVFKSMKMKKTEVVLSLLAVFLRDHGINDYNPERALTILLASRYGLLNEMEGMSWPEKTQ